MNKIVFVLFIQFFFYSGIFSVSHTNLSKHAASLLNYYLLNTKDLEEFIKGFQKADPSILSAKDLSEVKIFDLIQTKFSNDQSLKDNLSYSKTYFKKLALNSYIRCIEPGMLYYQILSIGKGDFFMINHSTVSINLSVFDSFSKLIKSDHQIKLDISKIIPGLAHGMLGMKKGEIRQIYIHPEFAYGLDSNFGKGKPIMVKVELLSFHKDCQNFSFPKLLPISCPTPLLPKDISTYEEFKQLRKKYYYQRGLISGAHLKKAAPTLSLDQIVNSLRKNDIQPVKKFAKDRNFVDLNWLIYQHHD